MAVARTISPGYTNGFLTSVPGWATLSYHSNGMINQIVHSNGVSDTQANDPDGMKRPASISSAKGATTLWSTGSYAYDGSGNVVKTGSGYFLYDRVSRLIEGRVYDGATGGGTQKLTGSAGASPAPTFHEQRVVHPTAPTLRSPDGAPFAQRS